MYNKIKTIIISFFLGTIMLIDAYSQVTIGSSGQPLEGALLQLKEQEVSGGEFNAFRGLLLPRVNLVEKDMLFPMFEDDGSGGYTGKNKSDEDTYHTGLVVYNVNECAPFGIGTYVWNGTEWVGVYNLPPLSDPAEVLATIPNMVSIPSGRDKRYYAARSFTFDFLTNIGNPTWSNFTAAINSGITFGDVGTLLQPGNVSVPSAGGSWPTSPATFSVLPNMLAAANITERKPWYTKESTIDIIMPLNA